MADSPALLDLNVFYDPGICSTLAFPPLRNVDHVVSVSIQVSSNSKKTLTSFTQFLIILVLIGMVFMIT